jgi:hypothetical protein
VHNALSLKRKQIANTNSIVTEVVENSNEDNFSRLSSGKRDILFVEKINLANKASHENRNPAHIAKNSSSENDDEVLHSEQENSNRKRFIVTPLKK